jgi:uncharacterized protein DUF6923
MTTKDPITLFTVAGTIRGVVFAPEAAGSCEARRMTLALAIAFVCAVGCTSLLRADVLYTVNGSTLSIVNTANMTAERLGSLGSYRIGGLTIGADGKLFGISTLAHQLVNIEINTETNKVVTTPINTLNKEVTLSTDIAWDPLDPAKGLYGVADFDPNTELFSIDAASAQTTKIANLGTGGIVGLAFDPSGKLWGIDGRFDTQEQLVRIDKQSGAVTPVGNRGLEAYPNIGGLAIGPTGSFWALNSIGNSVELLSIDKELGTAISVGIIANLRGDLGVFGLVAAIPEPTTLMTVLITIAWWYAVARCRTLKCNR